MNMSCLPSLSAPRLFKRIRITVVLLVMAGSLLFSSARAQNLFSQGNTPQEQPEQAADTAKVQPQPFPSSRIAAALSETFEALIQVDRDKLSPEELGEITRQVDTLFSVIDTFLSDTVLATLEGVGVRELDNISTQAELYIDRLTDLRESIGREAERSQERIGLVAGYDERWRLTLEESEEGEFPETRLQRIRRTIQMSDSLKTLLQHNLDSLLVQQDRLSEKRIRLDALDNDIRERKTEINQRLFSRDSPAFMGELSTLKDTTLLPRHLDQMKRSVRTDLDIFRTEFLIPLIIITLLVLILLVFAIWYKTHFARLMSVEKFEISDLHMTVIYSPVVVVVFVAAMLVRFIFPDLPHTISSLNLVVLMIPLVIIVIRLFGSLARLWVIALVVLFTLTFIYELIYYPDILIRIFLLGLSTAALAVYLWMFIRRPLMKRFKNQFLYQLFRFTLGAFSLMLTAAIAGNLAGAVRMAEFFTLVPIQIAILGMGIFVATQVVDTLIFLLLASNTFQRLNVFREEFRAVYRKTVRLINLLLWIFFFITILQIFRIREEFTEWGGNLLTGGFTIGEVEITPKSILIFIFVIWLSIVITRIVRHVLEKDVFTRVKVERGMPSTIILLLRIALITGGFFLAAAAAGLELTNLSIIIGAFSVGIGFGLQNIFNNMVSGLILAFERPIKVGDTVQVGELLGTVRSIGLRSSTVRSFDGAEVIVPNGNLISDQMINWSLSDMFRRMDIRLGVAYGTDPEMVLEIMEDVARENKQVNKYPAPKAYFLGFGDSSLDFRLLAWVDLNYRLEVESELKVAINRAVIEAGIEIPFPQRDLHIRSDHTKPSSD